MTPEEDVVISPAGLENLDLETLRFIWRARYGPPPTLRSPEILRLMLAWRMQAGTQGGLGPELRRSIRRSAAAPATPSIAPGSLLVREWKGQRHEVTAAGEGTYLYGGERYRSLSHVARRITGSRWNGPRFFGLRRAGAEG
jgi:hypothetical protein